MNELEVRVIVQKERLRHDRNFYLQKRYKKREKIFSYKLLQLKNLHAKKE